MLALGLGACTAPGPIPPAPPSTPHGAPTVPVAAESRWSPGQEIVACGVPVPIGVPVVLWTDPGGYDATSTSSRFLATGEVDERAGQLRYTPGREERESGRVLLEANSIDLGRLRSLVDLFVLHYDACGTSRRCFEVLHDVRGLSVHFLLDLDGTLYQTMDLRDQGWHARQANVRSIGVEIANIGAFPPERRAELDAWYRRDASGTRIEIPRAWGDGGLRAAGGVQRPARSEAITGIVQDQTLVMYDLTAAQYHSLVALAAGLCHLFPLIEPRVPRDAAGGVRTDVLSDEEFERTRGVIGHLHVSRDKVDPGPAFDWERFLARLRERLAQASAGRL
jgi:N-acetyl-anhydromuramyl-L-alanine amidase AmpD